MVKGNPKWCDQRIHSSDRQLGLDVGNEGCVCRNKLMEVQATLRELHVESDQDQEAVE